MSRLSHRGPGAMSKAILPFAPGNAACAGSSPNSPAANTVATSNALLTPPKANPQGSSTATSLPRHDAVGKVSLVLGAVHRIQFVRVLVVHDVPLHLEGGGELAGLLAQVVVQD